jgi:hypothetical protein
MLFICSPSVLLFSFGRAAVSGDLAPYCRFFTPRHLPVLKGEPRELCHAGKALSCTCFSGDLTLSFPEFAQHTVSCTLHSQLEAVHLSEYMSALGDYWVWGWELGEVQDRRACRAVWTGQGAGRPNS